MRTRRILPVILTIAGLFAIVSGIDAGEPVAPKRSKDLALAAVGDELLGEKPAVREAGKPVPEHKSLADKLQKGDLILPRPVPMNVGLDVVVAGRPLRTIQHAGKTYLPVPRTGLEYEIRIWNHGPRRIAAIVSVDGLSIITGQPASESHPGYLVAPYSSIRIKGWRRNLDVVAAFAFVDREQSYANLTGKPENIGVIGLIAIEEHVATPLPGVDRRESGKAAMRAQVGSIGTEYGREIDSRVQYVPFLRSTNKKSITMYYDTVAALRKAGVPVDPPMPIPFPMDQEFAPPPPGYKSNR